jgi:hypothetical protein
MQFGDYIVQHFKENEEDENKEWLRLTLYSSHHKYQEVGKKKRRF